MTGIQKSGAQSKGNYAIVNGLKMYYEVHGTGSPLVLIHGGGSTLYTNFGAILPMLAKAQNYWCGAPGSRAYSGQKFAFSFEQDADDVAEIITSLPHHSF